jgi:curved DNA-binding protein CbpA
VTARTKTGPGSGPTPSGSGSGPVARQVRPRRNSAATIEIERLLDAKIPLLDRGADHYTLLGITPEASVDGVRTAYFTLARKLHPDRLAAIGIDDEERRAQRLMAQVNAAFAVLNDPVKREEYALLQRRGGDAAVREEQSRADEIAMRVMRAEEAFKGGEMALRREQLTQAVEAFSLAVELQPKEPEYQALLAWAQFAAAKDKNAIAVPTRKALLRAAEANDRSISARFYLGRVERMLGREKEALLQFQEVLRIKPGHSEAASEVRVLESRLMKKR